MATPDKKPSHTKKAGIGAAVLFAGLAAISHFEGSKSLPYRDIGGVWTVCDGHTGPDVVPSKPWTDEQCKMVKTMDLARADAAVKSCTDFPLTDGQQIAFNDFAYNVGGGAFCRSSMPVLINVGHAKQACEIILKYTYVGKVDCRTAGKKCPGIVKRREWEYQKCIE